MDLDQLSELNKEFSDQFKKMNKQFVNLFQKRNNMTKEVEKKSDHPFPNKELELIMKLNNEGLIPIEDIAMISQLLHKYLNLRSYVFHEF